MSSCRFSFNFVPSGQVCFISLIFFLFFFSLPLYPSWFSALFLVSCLSPQTHCLLLTYTHTLSLGYYQDKSIWSIQGSGCHFIHIFSSLVTLLKATASIYPEWMNAPTDETRGKNEAHTVWNDHSQSACHFQTCSQILCFICNRKQLGEFEAFWHNVFYSSVSQETESCLPPPNDKRKAVETSSLGGKKMRCYSQWRHRAEKVGDETKMCLSCQLVSWPSSRLPLPSVRRGN